MPLSEIVPLVLVALLSSIPVALPSMFTLAAAVGARSLASRGVLPTSLSAVDEAAGTDILCSDKTGTLTRNELAVMSVCAMPPFDEAHVLAIAALASSDGGQDPVDAAIRGAAAAQADRRHARPHILRSIRPWAEALGSQLAPGGRCDPARAQGSVSTHRVTVSAVGQRSFDRGCAGSEGLQSPRGGCGAARQRWRWPDCRPQRSAARRIRRSGRGTT